MFFRLNVHITKSVFKHKTEGRNVKLRWFFYADKTCPFFSLSWCNEWWTQERYSSPFVGERQINYDVLFAKSQIRNLIVAKKTQFVRYLSGKRTEFSYNDRKKLHFAGNKKERKRCVNVDGKKPKPAEKMGFLIPT